MDDVLVEYSEDFDHDILVKYHADIDPLVKKENGDWIDLRAAEDVHLKTGEFALISLGVSMRLPDGYEALVIPRSSTFKNWGVIQTNHVGLIDNSYCGNEDIWKYPVLATRDTFIEKNSRICQFRILKSMGKVEFTECKSLGHKNRSGFGSSGKM